MKKARFKFSKRGISLFLFSAFLSSILLGINLITSVKAEAPPPPSILIFEDDFENYTVGTFPYAGGWELWWSGMGTEYQVVVDNVFVSPTKSLQLWGGTIPGVMAIASKPLSEDLTAIDYQAYVRVEDIQGENRCVAVVGFTKSVPWGARWYAIVEFLSDGIVYTGGRGAGGEQHALQSYEADRWYKTEVLLNKSNNRYSVWIDDQFMGEFTTYFNSSEIEAFSLGGGRANIKAYFDDVKLFGEAAPPPPLSFEDDFESYEIGTFPYVGGWELWYEGAGTEYQIVVDDVSFSPTKSLQLLGWGVEGSSHLAAVAALPFNWSSKIIGYSVYVRVDEVCTFATSAAVGLGKRVPGGHTNCNPVRFNSDGMIETRVAGDQLIPLQPYEPDTWYKIEVVLDTTTDTFSIWIDDELKGSGFNARFPSSEIEAFTLMGGYPNVKVYFDNVKLFGEAAPPPPLVIDRAFVSDERADVGSVQTIGFHAKWDNGSNVVGGDIYVNGTKYITNSTGWIFFNDVSSVVDRKTWIVTGVNCSGVTVYVQTALTPSIIWDQIKIVDRGVTEESVMVGETATIWFQATYEYNDIIFEDINGVLYVNGSEMSWSTTNRWEYNYTAAVHGSKAFIITGVSDSLYGLTVINDAIGAQTIIVLGQPTLTVSLDSSTTYVGYKVKISGKLTHPNGTGISGANLLLTYTVTGGESWNDITSVTTTAGGDYFVEWMPTATGNYLVRVSWEGNETLYVAGTEVYSTLAVTPVEGKYVFSVISNSTVSELSFNSTSRVLSFTVSGPSGTIGYTKVTIAKTLIGDISELKVYLDGNQINYTVTSTDASLLLYFTYQHSTHEVVVSLGPSPFIPPQLITPLSLSILAVALAVATVILIFKIRKGTPTTILDSVLK